MREYTKFDAMGLAQLIQRKEVSPAELLEAALARMQAANPKINAVTLDHRELARAAAQARPFDGPFSGVPFLLKDLYAAFSGSITSNGSNFFRGNEAKQDSEWVARCRRAGMNIFGKTNTPEFGLTITTEPVAWGATRNPWKLTHSAGGSSGGSAAAVAAGIVPIAHASDGGGSIRIPSSCCGLFGLKPTRGRNPAGPLRGEGWAGMSTEHAISRTVRDSAALLDATCGPDVGAPYFAPPPERPFLSEVGMPPGRLRIGVHTRTHDGAPIHPECARAVQDAAQLAESFGHHIEEVAPSFVGAAFNQLFRTIIAGNMLNTLRAHAAETNRTLSSSDVEATTWVLASAGERFTAADYANAVQSIHAVGRNVGSCFENFDVLMTPTLPDPPMPLGYFDMNSTDFDTQGRRVSRGTTFTAVFNASGNPAASLPLYWTADGLPVGVQLVAAYGSEALLFKVAAQFEAAKPWFDRQPSL